ncbi:uncharacterized protein LOC131847980 [Achroia grisella]|uniref:uncharacterized protein LOC131847980 n=1 Tax=Achroia grisella TaxID=688607 RepID=UPI0027D2BC58|nr:uncharacterized protein LOC131847980 [Achroia grisella]
MITRSRSKIMASHDVPTTSHAEPLCHSRGSSIVDVVDRICVDDGDAACSLRSAQSKSRVSSSSVKARRAAVEAAYKRRQYEREAMLAQRLSEVEDAEFRAEIEQINADADCEGSRRSRSTSTRMRTQQWVKNNVNTKVCDNSEEQREVPQPSYLAPTVPVASQAAASQIAYTSRIQHM